MQARLRRLDERDLRRQMSCIRATMQVRVARHGHLRLEENDAPTSGAPVRVGREEFTHEAVRIAQQIREDALGDISSGVIWMTVRFGFSVQRFRLELSGPGLYDGGIGIALFLSSPEKVTGAAGMRDLAMASVYPFRAILRDSGSARLGKEFGIGGGSGIGSFVYGLTRCGMYLNDESLLHDARRAALLISDSGIAEDSAFDVIGGSAGAILGLLSLYQATGEETVLDRAVVCAQHLLNCRTASAEGCAPGHLQGRGRWQDSLVGRPELRMR